ncbi:MAG: DUF5658 family protein [Thermofilum sp.]|nr:DUF5658 family protein [Thermofilum sp.]
MGVEREGAISLAMTLLGRYLDAIITYAIVYGGLGYEANPHMRPYIHNPPALLLIQTLGGIVIWLILYLAGRVAGGRIRQALLRLAPALSWLPVFNNLLTPFGFSPLAILYAR